MNEKWYELTPEQIAKKFDSNIISGISEASAAERLKTYGENSLYTESRSLYKNNLRHILTDLTVLLLIFTALISTAFNQNISAFVIICIIALNVTAAVTAFVKSKEILRDTSIKAGPYVKVVRDGKTIFTDSRQIVLGDVIFLSAGDIVPADARIIQADKLTVMQQEITGEKNPVRKRAGFASSRGSNLSSAEQTNILFASSIVISGSGRAIICSTSENTAISKLKKETPENSIPSYEKLRIFKLMRKYSSVWALCMLAAVFIIAVLDIIFGRNSGRSLFDSFITGLTVAVASMSSYYLTFSYIIVSFGVLGLRRRRKGYDSGALVKNIEKLEEAKDINVLIIPRSALIASDAVCIDRIIASENERTVGAHGFKRFCGEFLKLSVVTTGRYGANRLMSDNLSGNSIYTSEEEMIISCASKFGLYNSSLEGDYIQIDHVGISDGSRFDTTLCIHSGKYISLSRGEARKLLQCCSFYCDSTGKHRITAEKLNEYNNYIKSAAKKFCRVVAVASKETQYTNLRRLIANQSDLVLNGFIVIKEPVAEGAAQNISACLEAGVRVVMTCENSSEIGEATARSLGIINKESEIITGAQISGMKPDIFRINIPLYNMYIGLSAGQLDSLVYMMRSDGYKVGILADRLDKIAVLSEADVGFAFSEELSSGLGLGKGRKAPIITGEKKESTGTAALRYKSSVVLLPPEKSGFGGFNAMLGTVKSSAQIYNNIINAVAYLLTTQSARLIPVLWGVLCGKYIMTPVQILFSGFIVDFAAVFTIAFQTPSPGILKNRGNIERKISKPFYSNIPYLAFGCIWAVLMIITTYASSSVKSGLSSAQLVSASFLGFTLTQFILLFEIKRKSSVFSTKVSINGIGLLTAVFCAGLFMLSLLIPDLGSLFGITTFGLNGVWIMLIPVLFTMVAAEIYKFINGDSHAGAWIKLKLRKIISRDKNKSSYEEGQPKISHADNETESERNDLFADFDLESFIKISESDSEDFELDYTMPGQAKIVNGNQGNSETDETEKKNSDNETNDEDSKKSGEKPSNKITVTDPVSEENTSEKNYPPIKIDAIDSVLNTDNTETISSENESFEIGNEIIESIFSAGNNKDT